MPTFMVTDPTSGRKVRLTGDSPPTDAELEEIFAGLPSLDQVAQQPQAKTFQQRPTGEKALGVLGAGAQLVSGALAEPVAGLVGLGASILPGEPGAGARAVQATREALTIDAGEAGQQFLQEGVTGALEAGQTLLGGEDAPLTQLATGSIDLQNQLANQAAEAGNPGLATLIKTLPTAALEAVPAALGIRAAGRAAGITPTPDVITPTRTTVADVTEAIPQIPQSRNKKEIAQLIQTGSKEDALATFELVPTRRGVAPRVKTDKEATAAVKQGFSEGSIQSLKVSTPETQQNFDKMLTIADKIKKEEAFGMRNRPSDVLGDSLVQRLNVVMAANKRAGTAIDRVSKSLAGKQVDLSSASDNFASALDGLGARIVDNGKGGFKIDYENYIGSKGDRGPLNEVIRIMNIKGSGQSGGFVDGLSAHDMKRAIDNNVTWGAKKTAISRDASEALKDFRRDIDTVLDESFPAYNDANIAYGDTIEVLNDFQDVAGQKMKLKGVNADKATGTLMRRIAGNAQSRVRLLDSVDAINDVVAKHGDFTGQKLIGKGKKTVFNDDLETQVMLANQLDSVVGIAPSTSLQGIFDASLARSAAQTAATGTGGIGVAIDVGAKVLNKALQRNDKAAIKAAKALVRKELAKGKRP